MEANLVFLGCSEEQIDEILLSIKDLEGINIVIIYEIMNNKKNLFNNCIVTEGDNKIIIQKLIKDRP